MFTIPVLNTQGKEIDTLKLDESVFSDKIPSSSLQQVICAYRAAQRCGLAQTKTRGEVSGGGRKPWKQKGTGRARAGSTRSPLWRHGGVVFGPHPRDFSFSVPKKMKDLALKYALSAKVLENKLIVVEDLPLEKPKTKEIAKLCAQLNLSAKDKRVLMLAGEVAADFKRACANVAYLRLELCRNVNTYDVLAAHKVVITRDGLKALVGRLKQ